MIPMQPVTNLGRFAVKTGLEIIPAFKDYPPWKMTVEVTGTSFKKTRTELFRLMNKKFYGCWHGTVKVRPIQTGETTRYVATTTVTANVKVIDLSTEKIIFQTVKPLPLPKDTAPVDIDAVTPPLPPNPNVVTVQDINGPPVPPVIITPANIESIPPDTKVTGAVTPADSLIPPPGMVIKKEKPKKKSPKKKA